MTKSEESRALEANKDIVLSLAKKYVSYGVDFDDLVQEGYLGFLQGIRKWSPEGGASLRTYAGQWAATYIRRLVGTDSNGKLRPEERTASFDEGLGGSEERTLHEVLPSSTFESPEEIYERKERIEMVLGAMSDTEASVFRQRSEGASYENIGVGLGMSRSRAHQIKKSFTKTARRVFRA